MIHGHCAPSQALEPLAHHLAHFCRVILLDMPGYNGSEPVDHADLEAARSRIIETLDALSIARCSLLGFSLWRVARLRSGAP